MGHDLATALRRVPFFSALSDREVEQIATRLAQRTFNEGQAITREGETGVGFFLILDGNAAVSIGGEPRGTLGPGDHFGEIALIDDGPRSATIVAATDVRCVGMTAWDFKPFVERHPEIAWTLLQTLARRLRDAETLEA
jgi:CRP/FNR family transcriptional regulator